MKTYTFWWGVAFVPETEADVTVLDALPKEVTNAYEYGKIGWETHPEDLSFYSDRISDIPMGKIFVINR